MTGCKNGKKEDRNIVSSIQRSNSSINRIYDFPKSATEIPNKYLIFDSWERVIKIFATLISFAGFVSLFLWAAYISSWNLNDAAFIIQKEGLGGGITRVLPLMSAHIVVFIIVVVMAFILIFPVFFVRDRYMKCKKNLLKKHNSSMKHCDAIFKIHSNSKGDILNHWLRHKNAISILPMEKTHNLECLQKGILNMYRKYKRINLLKNVGIILIFFILAVFMWIIEFFSFRWIGRRVFKVTSGEVDPSLSSWIKEDDAAFLFTFIILVLCLVFISYREIGYTYKDVSRNYRDMQKIVLILTLAFSIFFPFYMFNGIYSKGYGTECIYIKVEEGNSSSQRNKIYESISSGGDDVTKVIAADADGTEHLYSLSSYVYSEDKDYLNIMVFSVRHWHENDNIYYPEHDLLGHRQGILMSIKKNSIEDRHVSSPYCFNGGS